MLSCVKEYAPERPQLLEAGIEYNLSADLGDNCHVGWVHEHDVEHGDCKAGRKFVFLWL